MENLYEFLKGRLGRRLENDSGRQLVAYRSEWRDYIEVVYGTDSLFPLWVYPSGEVWETRYGRQWRKIAVGDQGMVYTVPQVFKDPSDGVQFVIEPRPIK